MKRVRRWWRRYRRLVAVVFCCDLTWTVVSGHFAHGRTLYALMAATFIAWCGGHAEATSGSWIRLRGATTVTEPMELGPVVRIVGSNNRITNMRATP